MLEQNIMYNEAVKRFSKVLLNNAFDLVPYGKERSYSHLDNHTLGAFHKTFNEWAWHQNIKQYMQDHEDDFEDKSKLSVEGILSHMAEEYESADCEREIYQYYLTDCTEEDVHWYQSKYGLQFAFCADLGDKWVLLVPHFGTSWDGVTWKQSTVLPDSNESPDIEEDYLSEVKKEIEIYLSEIAS